MRSFCGPCICPFPSRYHPSISTFFPHCLVPFDFISFFVFPLTFTCKAFSHVDFVYQSFSSLEDLSLRYSEQNIFLEILKKKRFRQNLKKFVAAKIIHFELYTIFNHTWAWEYFVNELTKRTVSAIFAPLKLTIT